MSSILTVVTQAQSYDLTILDTARQELGIADSDTSQDAKLTRWIHEASEEVAAYCGRVFAQEKVSETFLLGFGQDSAIRLSRYPVTLIESVTADGSVLTASDYELDANSGLLYRCNGCWRCRKIVVVYTAGYDLLDSLPRPLERAVLTMMRYRYSASTRDPAIRSESLQGVYDVSYWVGAIPGGASSSLPPEVADILAPYRDSSGVIA